MSTANVLALVQDAATDLSLKAPTEVIANTTSNEVIKLRRHLIRTIRFLAGAHDWQILRREQTFTTVAAAAQTDTPLPSDFLRFIEGSIWNRASRTRVNGPLTPAEWQARQASVTTSAFDEFMIRQDTFLIDPVPPASETIAYEYVTKNIGTDSAGTTERSAFTLDTDLPYFDEELLILGLVWRYRKAEGQDYAEEYRDFQLRLVDMIKMDGGRRTLVMSGNQRQAFVPEPPITPDTLTGLS
jgi:hypothetical protein